MVQAAKAMAALGIKALTEPDLIAAAKADLKKRTARTPYVCPVPPERVAAAGYVGGVRPRASASYS